MSRILELKDNGSTEPQVVAIYSCTPKTALICYIMQNVFHNYHSWEYPETLEGIWESSIIKNNWYYTDSEGQRTLAAYA